MSCLVKPRLLHEGEVSVCLGKTENVSNASSRRLGFSGSSEFFSEKKKIYIYITEKQNK